MLCSLRDEDKGMGIGVSELRGRQNGCERGRMGLLCVLLIMLLLILLLLQLNGSHFPDPLLDVL